MEGALERSAVTRGLHQPPPSVTAAMVARSRGLAGPRFSPDGRRLAWVETVAGRSDLVVAPTDASGPPLLVTADAATGPYAGCTPRGAPRVYAHAYGPVWAAHAP